MGGDGGGDVVKISDLHGIGSLYVVGNVFCPRSWIYGEGETQKIHGKSVGKWISVIL